MGIGTTFLSYVCIGEGTMLNNWNHSFVRFLLVGVINTIIGLSIMYLFLNFFHFSYWISTFVGNTIGAVVSFYLNKSFTFKNREGYLWSSIKFIIVILSCYFLAYVLGLELVTFLLKQLEYRNDLVEKNVAILFGTGLYTILNYIGQRYFVFRSTRQVLKS